MKKIVAFLLALSVCGISTHAQQRSGGSVDPFKIKYISGAGNYATAGVALSSNGQTVNPAIKNLILVLFGQSNCATVIPSVYSPANPTKIDQLNIYDGAIRVNSAPLIGTSWPLSNGVPIYGNGNAFVQVADELISAGKFDRVILVPACVGATSVADWSPGSYLEDIIPVTFRRIAANGIVAGANVTIAVIWSQGESDTQNGTSQAAYTASLNANIAASRTAGFTGLWFVNTESYNSGVTSANVTNAQAAVVNHGANVWAGANMDSLVGNVCVGATACRQADQTHLTFTGGGSLSPLMRTAMGLAGAPF